MGSSARRRPASTCSPSIGCFEARIFATAVTRVVKTRGKKHKPFFLLQPPVAVRPPHSRCSPLALLQHPCPSLACM